MFLFVAQGFGFLFMPFFFKENKFSRTEYEKFLISNNLSAPLFEKNLLDQEKKRQLLSYLSGGINIPDFIKNNPTYSSTISKNSKS